MRPSTRQQIKGKAQEMKGRAKQVAGRLAKNRDLEARGAVEKTAGKARRKGAQIRRVFEE